MDDIRRHQEKMQEMANQLRALQMEFERKEEARLEGRLRQIVREELERWEKQLEMRLRMNARPVL